MNVYEKYKEDMEHEEYFNSQKNANEDKATPLKYLTNDKN